MKRKLLCVELNEFNTVFVKRLAEELGLKNLQRIFSLSEIKTTTDDVYDSNFLEPWSQWVSVHTGRPAREHQIQHLGDVPHLGFDQVWERLSKQGVSSGVWGAMNASRADADQCKFFLPDPWTFSERAYPEELNALLDFPRFISKNYVKPSKKELLRGIYRMLAFLKKEGVASEFLKRIPVLIKDHVRYGFQHFLYISLFDYLSAVLFLKYKERYQVDFNLIFMNSIAHLQHHHWHGQHAKDNPEISHGLKIVDEIFGLFLESVDKNHEDIFVFNAFSQMNTNHEKPWILYRQKNHSIFLKDAGLQSTKVESHMTHDAHVFFASKKERDHACDVLKAATIKGIPFFLVETYPQDDFKLFYRIQFTDHLTEDAVMSINSMELNFFKYFKNIVVRTGKHIQTGVLYSSRELKEKQIHNHEINALILDYFYPEDRTPIHNTIQA